MVLVKGVVERMQDMRGKMYFFVAVQICRADTAYRRSGSVLLEKLIGAINAQTGFVACRAR